MADTILKILDYMPTAAVLIGHGQLLASNAMARHYLSLPEGSAPLPPYLAVLTESADQTGTFSSGLSRYRFRVTQREEGTLLTFTPEEQLGLTDTQLDGSLRQMRTLLSDLLMELNAQPPERRGELYKTFHRLCRLVGNMELKRSTGTGEGIPFRPTTIDLVLFCSTLTDEAADLLRDRGVALDFRCKLPTLLVVADPNLLRRMLLELIANSVQAIKTGTVTLALRLQGQRAILSLTDSGAPLTQRRLNAMLQQDTDLRLPLPDAGAGLGLPLVREIVALHGGALLIPTDAPSPTLAVSLPISPDTHLNTMSPAPPVDRDGGLSPTLVALSDVLSPDSFELAELD